MTVRNITVLGATGSIGASTLDVVARHPGRFRIAALTANTGTKAMLEACLRFRPAYAVMVERTAADALRSALREAGVDTQVLAGAQGLAQVAVLPEVDTVMAAIVGAAGLSPTLAAARAGKRVLLANKEALVMAGALCAAVPVGPGDRFTATFAELGSVSIHFTGPARASEGNV